jgi:translation initiation factor 2 subunit 1
VSHSESDAVWGTLPKPPVPAVLSLLQATVARRLTPQPIKIRADVELTCYTPAGIAAIKKALRAGERASSEQVPIKARLVAPPLYVLSTNATDKFAAVDRLERAIEFMQTKIEEQGGTLVVKMKVCLEATHIPESSASNPRPIYSLRRFRRRTTRTWRR